MDPQPVLIVARPAEGGIRGHIISLIEHLDRGRFSVGLAAPAKLLKSLPGNLPPHSLHDLPIGAKPGPLDIIAAARVATLARGGYGIVHAQGIRAGLVCAMARSLSRFKLIVTYHNLPPDSKLSAQIISVIGRRASASIAVSYAVAGQIGDGAPVIIPNGIDLDRFERTDRQDSRGNLGLGSGDFAVAVVARLAREKGIDVVIRAARLVPDTAILIAGDGPERARLESSAPANMHFLGRVDDAASVLAASDVVVIPSRREGQGIVALEAMASGAVVIATDVGGLPEMVEHEVTGLLAPPDDACAVADAIRRLCGDRELRGRLAAAGREWARANGDVRARIREIENVYSLAIEEPKGIQQPI